MAVKKSRKKIQPVLDGITINIMSVVDAVSALADGALDQSIYLYDTNKANGSTGLGTGYLETKVNLGDTLIWNIIAIEPEAFVDIESIDIDTAYCNPQKRYYPGTDVAYWIGQVQKPLSELPYQVHYKVSTREGTFTWSLKLKSDLSIQPSTALKASK
jgi:hypothetical protein